MKPSPSTSGYRKATLNGFYKRFIVGNRSLQLCVPIHQAFTAVNKTRFEKVEECLPYCAGTGFVERESRAFPVARATKLTQLVQNAGSVLVFPFPDPSDQFFAADFVAGFVFCYPDATLNNCLRGDSSVVGARHPKRVVPHHSMLPYQNVLKRVVQGMPQVQRTRYIRWRYDHAERGTSRIYRSMEQVQPVPQFQAVFLGCCRIELLG